MSVSAEPSARPVRRPGFRLLPADGGLGWTPFAWLIYLSALAFEPIAVTRAGRPSLWLWVLTLAGIAAFLPAYFHGYWVRGVRLMRVIAYIASLGLVLSPVNTGACVFFVYACSFAGRLDRTGYALRTIAVVTAVGLLLGAFIAVAPFYWLTVALVGPAVGAVNLHFEQTGEAQRKLRLAQEEIEQLAAVAERERIARDLHDVLGHTLSLIVLKSELAVKLADRDLTRAADEMRDVEEVARRTLQDVREAIRGYRPTLQDEAVRARTMLKAARIEGRFDIAPGPLARAIEETLSLALREAVTNVVRHSGAARCTVRLEHDLLRVEDDGRGVGDDEGNGIRGLRERVTAAGGLLSLRPGAAGGTVLEVQL